MGLCTTTVNALSLEMDMTLTTTFSEMRTILEQEGYQEILHGIEVCTYEEDVPHEAYESALYFVRKEINSLANQAREAIFLM